MGTVFMLVDEAHGCYFQLNKSLPWNEALNCDVFLDMKGSGPHGPHTWKAMQQWSSWGNLLPEQLLKELFDFLEKAAWKVRLAADCWDTSPDYFDCLRMLDCAGHIWGTRREVCSGCGRESLIVKGETICNRCEWARDE